MSSDNLLYRETQKFGAAMGVVLAISLAFSLGILGVIFYQLKESGKLGSDFLIPVIIVVVVMSLLESIFYFTKLVIEVRESGVFVRLYPFYRKFKEIPLDTCTSVNAVTYSPLGEYGGWGVRYTLKGKCYNCKGNQGVKLEYANGKHIMLGTQKPQELEAAIKIALRKHSTGF